jgi:hypothetical protein
MYKVDTDAIALKVKQEFAAKEKHLARSEYPERSRQSYRFQTVIDSKGIYILDSRGRPLPLDFVGIGIPPSFYQVAIPAVSNADHYRDENPCPVRFSHHVHDSPHPTGKA